jgi:hypothetical protein
VGDKQTGDETMVQATKTTVGMVVVAVFLHGGFLIGSGCWVVAQRVKEVDAPTLSNPSREIITPPRMKRTGTTNVALCRLDMLDKTVDIFSPGFLVHPMMELFTFDATPTSHLQLEDSDLESELKVIQEEEPEAEEDDLRLIQTFQKRQVSLSAFECRERLQQWRNDMVSPRL